MKYHHRWCRFAIGTFLLKTKTFTKLFNHNYI